MGQFQDKMGGREAYIGTKGCMGGVMLQGGE